MISDFARRLKSGAARGARKFSRDQSGNVLMLTAAAIVPLIGIIGSGIDIGRSYMTQLRLQQACDAGVLAGRRAMAGGKYIGTPTEKANAMFQFNFPQGMYGTENVQFLSSGGETSVVGTASAVLPTSLMHIFGFDQFNLSVSCGAKLEIANTDIMMVLDITTSMAGSRLIELKKAGKSFVDAVTSADVGDGRVRIGLVPYSLGVNLTDVFAGKEKAWISKSVSLPSSRYSTVTTVSGRNRVTTYTHVFENRNFDVSDILDKPSGEAKYSDITSSVVTVKWDGCLDEARRDRYPSTNPNAKYYDLDIDHVPGKVEGDEWKLHLPDLVFLRDPGRSTQTYSTTSSSRITSYSSVAKRMTSNSNLTYKCPPSKAQKLKTVTKDNKEDIKGLIENLAVQGVTYHDTGMVWGGRLISPDGLFGAENQDSLTPNRRPIYRHILFMTDGEMDTSWVDYAHQGLEINMPWVGTPSGTRWSDTRGASQSINDPSDRLHIPRFNYICERIKSKGIKIWVVAYALPATSDMTSLRNCASEGGLYMASGSTTLEQVFVSIAGQISRLRVSQ